MLPYISCLRNGKSSILEEKVVNFVLIQIWFTLIFRKFLIVLIPFLLLWAPGRRRFAVLVVLAVFMYPQEHFRYLYDCHWTITLYLEAWRFEKLVKVLQSDVKELEVISRRTNVLFSAIKCKNTIAIWWTVRKTL